LLNFLELAPIPNLQGKNVRLHRGRRALGRNSEMLKAKDIMTTDVICVKKDTPIYEAAQILMKNDITGMPVVEDDMTLIGIISEKDLLRLIYAGENTRDSTVESFMTQPAACYKEDDSLNTIIDFMLINYFRRVPVTSRDGKVVGIISRPDVLAYILNSKQAQAALHSSP
jgi:CBS domain-containing protein